MGRNLDRNESAVQFKEYHRGCILGLLPIQFQSFNKLLPHIKQKHVRNSKSKKHNISSILPTPKKDNGNLPQQPQLRRTYSIHHLEPPCNYFEGSTDNIVSHPRMFENAEMLDDELIACNSEHFDEQELPDQSAVDEDPQFRDHNGLAGETCEDFFHVFQIDKRLLMKTSKDLDIADSAHCQGYLKSHGIQSFKRSGSFPMSNNPCNAYGGLTPSKLESKVTEVWLSSSSFSSTSSPSFHCSTNILPRSLSCTLPITIREELATQKATQYETDHMELDYNLNIRKYKLGRIRRANASLEIYTKLFETSFKRDENLNISRSLRLSNQDEVGVNPAESGILRKIQSMREAPQAERASDSIEFSKLANKSANLSIESESKDGSCCSDSLTLTLTEDMHIKCGSDRYSNSLSQLREEAIANSYDDIDEGSSTTGEIVRVAFKYEQHALTILESLGAGNSLYNSPKLHNEHLLTDLVNEALLDVYIIFDAYWPTHLCWSSKCHLHPLPNTEHHVTRNVLSTIQKLQSLSLKTGDSMHDVVSFDLAQGDSWMNLQADAESLGLALDEIIFDELVEELLYE